MRFFNNLRIQNKMIMSFVVVLVLAIALGLYAIRQLQFIGTQVTNVEENVLAFTPLSEMKGDANRLQALAGEMILADPAGRATIAAEQEAVRRDFDLRWRDYAPTMDSGAEPPTPTSSTSPSNS
jgi:hypothetical protein